MKTPTKILILLAVAAAVAAAVVLRQHKTPSVSDAQTPAGVTAATQSAASVVAAKIPRLVDLGAGKCIPCKMMKPVLDELRRDYASKFKTEFIDVWENPDEGKKYGIEMIPTQIFYDAEGRELFRHTGFYGKEDILAKWKEFGVDTGGESSAGMTREPAEIQRGANHSGGQTLAMASEMGRERDSILPASTPRGMIGPMKLGIIISQTEPETVFNALRLANYSLKQGDSVKIFLVGKGVELDKINDVKFNVREQAEAVIAAGGKFLACGTCLKLRASEGSEICPLSTLKDFYEIVRDSDRLVTF